MPAYGFQQRPTGECEDSTFDESHIIRISLLNHAGAFGRSLMRLVINELKAANKYSAFSNKQQPCQTEPYY
jgi:hypothetical protein